MALADSQTAIGAVTRLLEDHLLRHSFVVSIGRPERASQTDTSAKLNLYLYEAEFDGAMRNVELDPERPRPLWLTLKYLLTAFDEGESSDSAAAHELLGRGATALNALNFLTLDAAVDANVRLALENNPEPLKLVFDPAPVDLIARLMQGSEERYRFSLAFQVRPVMLLPDEPPSFSLLVGVDYTQAPQQIIGADGVEIATLPSLGPRLNRVEPAVFEPGDLIRLYGDDLHLAGLECLLGSVPLRVTGQRPDRIDVEVASTAGPLAGTLSAGEHPLSVRQPVSARRSRSSNLLLGRLRPVVSSAQLTAGGALQIDGSLLGTDSDDILLAAYSAGAVVRLFDSPTPSADQSGLTQPGAQAALPPGRYQVIVRVNGQQARQSPLIVVE